MASSLSSLRHDSIFDSFENARSSLQPDLIFQLDLADGPTIESAHNILSLLQSFDKFKGV
jgi:hypothetical protein